MTKETNNHNPPVRASAAIVVHRLLYGILWFAAGALFFNVLFSAGDPSNWFPELTRKAQLYFLVITALAATGFMVLWSRYVFAVWWVVALDLVIPLVVLFPFFHIISENLHWDEGVVLAFIILCHVVMAIWLGCSKQTKRYFTECFDYT